MRAALSLVPPAILLVATLASAQPFSSFRRTDVAGVNAPRAIAAGDVTGDGWQDIVLGSTNPPAISIIRNAGIEEGDDGKQLKDPVIMPVSGGPFDLALGDLNRDGTLDIAVANADADAITLLFGTGNGGFAAPVNLPLPGNPRGIAIGDFNRDGIPDIVATKFTATTVDVLYGAGDGTFPRRLALESPRGTQGAQGVVAGDFDHDGWGDFAVASTSGSIRVYKMFATGAVVIDLTAAAVGWNVIAAADLDRDGSQDLAIASTASSIVQVLYNRASGWTASAQIPVAASPRGIEIKDLNRDGRSDIVVAGRAASLATVITRADNGAFSTSDFASGSGARDVAIADFDNDGRVDVATANEFGDGASVIHNTTDSPRAGFAFDAGATAPFDGTALAVADFDHNGKLDILRSFIVEFDDHTQSRRLPIGSTAAVADFNADGHPDVVASFGKALRMLFGDGRRGFADGPSTSLTGFAVLLQQADFNRDGRPDLALVLAREFDSAPAIELWLGRGDGTFTRTLHVDGEWHSIAVGDVDEDAIPDLLAASDTGVSIWLTDGRGGTRSTKTFDVGTPRFGLTLADLNEDGTLDLVAVDSAPLDRFIIAATHFTVARGHGDGTFETSAVYETAVPGVFDELFRPVLASDLNGDGHLDLFSSNGVMFVGSGLGDFGDPLRFLAAGTSSAVTADLNGDGLLDLVGFRRADDSGQFVDMLNTTRTNNQAPIGLDLPDTLIWPYDRTWWDTEENWFDTLPDIVTDPDLHALRWRWTLDDGTVLSTRPQMAPVDLRPGTYHGTLTVDDYRGGVASDAFTLQIPPFKETVLLPGSFSAQLHGAWQRVEDPTAAFGARVWHPDAGAPKQAEPLASPANYFEMGFVADPTQEYKLWIRLKAENDNWANDSVFVQFTGGKDAAGNPVYEIGTASALAVNLEECSNCGESGWGWEDDGWGAVNRNGVALRFPEGGAQTIRIQTREDGVSIDQIVLSSEKYKAKRPGTAKDDTVKLNPSGPDLLPRR
jgi:FG-GAP-like repeat